MHWYMGHTMLHRASMSFKSVQIVHGVYSLLHK